MTGFILAIEQLRKNFGGVIAVNDVDLSIKKGSISSIIGPNGAGKTTIFNLISGFLKPSRGKVIFYGEDISRKKVHEIAKMGIARTFQHVQVFANMTLVENVMVGRHIRSSTGLLNSCLFPPFYRREEKEIQEQALKWLETVALAQYAGQTAGNLPLGSQRMLEIARALAMEPEILLLDEPASGLNARETFKMGELIEKIKALDITVILVEHDMELVMDISDQIAVLNFGQLIAQGKPAEIQENTEVIAAYLGD
jgi:branched-chain amino acid transport system ATP-binding protein